MIQDVAESQRWPPGRWYTLIAVVLGAQFGLILWLGKPRPVVLHPPADLAPLLQLAGPGASQTLSFNDPTLFALPHPESFSGPAWLTILPQKFRRTDPPRFLELAEGALGIEFEGFMATNRLEGLPAIAQPELALKLPVVQETATLPQSSRLRLTGALAGRRLLVSPKLPSWPNAEILTDTVVQLLIDSDGKPVSATLFSKSGSTEADQHAVRAADHVRFEPLKQTDPINPMQGLAWGQLVFEWHTLPLPSTNSPAETSATKP